jgi:hypothetical protein
MSGNSLRREVLLSALLAAILASDRPSAAAPGGPEPPVAATAAGQGPKAPDFFVGRPHAWVGVRGGWFVASAGSDLYDFVEGQLTLDDSDFRAGMLGISGGFVITPRVDVVISVDLSESSATSEFRDYVDQDFRPINQRTTLKEADVSFSATYALMPRFRQASRFASVLQRVVPYVGGGAGLLNYEFQQSGDFVDFADMSVFTTTLRSSGTALNMHVVGGVDFQLYRSLFATVQARYTWADAEPGRDFVGCDPIDLSGFRFSVGASYVF